MATTYIKKMQKKQSLRPGRMVIRASKMMKYLSIIFLSLVAVSLALYFAGLFAPGMARG